MGEIKPTRDGTLVDLVDTILTRGVIINADVIISVAGIPLIGINLNAALAGMETMLKYGMMEAWDESIRKYYAEEIIEKIPLMEDEEIILQTFASYKYAEGIHNLWRPGQLYLTDKRLFLFRKKPAEMLLETTLERIKKLVINNDGHFVGEKEILYILLDNGEVISINTRNVVELREEIENRMKAIGLEPKQEISIPFKERKLQFLKEDEYVVRTEKIWCLYPESWIMKSRWKPGRMYVTNKRVRWQYEFDPIILFDVPIGSITELVIEEQIVNVRERKIDNIAGRMKNDYTLFLAYGTSQDEQRILFSGEEKKLNSLKFAIESVETQLMPIVA